MTPVKRKYPVGIQSFEKLRMDGYIYVDKTELVYKMITEGCPYFLSRPRRFGKSLLVSTLAAVFEGRRDLFEAFTTEDGIKQPELFISRSDWRWDKYPVFRFDFSAGDLQTIEQLDTLIDQTLKGYERQYGITPEVKDANIRMVDLMRTAHQQTGKRVVVLVDEYDNFILHALGDIERVTQARSRFQNVFGPLKAEDDHLQFAFITGISKFSQMGIFSKLNNLQNISMVPAFDTLCGISEEELTTQLQTDIEVLSEANGRSYDEQLAELKQMYDGYHFSHRMTDIYNPFSLINVFKSHEIGNYWFDRGTSGSLIDLLAHMPPVDVTAIEHNIYPSSMFDLPFQNFEDPLPILYQSGYLTLKAAERDNSEYYYTLGMPNQEVRQGFAECLYKHVTGKGSEASRGQFFQAYLRFRREGELKPFIEALKAFYAGLPYQWEKDNRNEHYYHALLYTLLVSFGADVVAEEPTAKGMADLTIRMPKGIYVVEVKYDHTAQEALDQINTKGYAEKYCSDGRPVTKIGIAFSSAEWNITEWKTEKQN